MRKVVESIKANMFYVIESKIINITILLFVLCILGISCSGQQRKEKDVKEVTTNGEKIGTIKLNKADFLVKNIIFL